MELLIRLFEILKDSLVSFMLSSWFSPKIFFESDVSLSHSILISSFKTGQAFSVLYNRFVCPTYQSNRINMWLITFLRLSSLFSFCASISSSAISAAADIVKTNPFLISDNLLSPLLGNGIVFLYLVTASFNIGTRLLLRFAGIFKGAFPKYHNAVLENKCLFCVCK